MDFSNLLQLIPSGGAVIIVAIIGILTWWSRERDSLRQAERDMRMELRQDIDVLKKDHLLCTNRLVVVDAEIQRCREESRRISQSLADLRNDFWRHYTKDIHNESTLGTAPLLSEEK